MDFAFSNLIARNFIDLSRESHIEILAARNAVREFMLTSRKISEAEHLRFIESLKSDKSKIYFAIYQESQMLGVICLNHIDLANKNAFFGIYSAFGAKSGANLLKMLKFIAFSELNLRILYAKVLSTNLRAIRFYQKHGFMRCGALIEAIKRDGKFIDLEIYALRNESLREEAQ